MESRKVWTVVTLIDPETGERNPRGMRETVAENLSLKAATRLAKTDPDYKIRDGGAL